MKTPTHLPRLKILARMTAAAFSLCAAGAGATTFGNMPMLGVGSSYPPNVLLALSVEFPTAGAAYQEEGTDSGSNPIRLTDAKFRANKYLGYFDPDKCYTYNGTYFTPFRMADANRYCTGSSEFSGNALNWMTMTTIDIFRQAMTGGNRAKTTGRVFKNIDSDYENGDLQGTTILRRAFVNVAQNGNSIYGLHKREIDRSLAGRVLPSSLIPANGGHVALRNYAFQVIFGSDAWTNPSGAQQLYNAQVEVCRPDMPEANCRAYSTNNLKPEGLMQENIAKMRFSAFGYLNKSGKEVNGGVMRARMKSLLGETTTGGIELGREINGQTGQFVTNPDKEDAAESRVANSGVINYLNKFGDSGRYKERDPAAELYYAGLRYLRNKGNLQDYYQHANSETNDNFPAIKTWNDPLLRKGETVSSKEAVCRPNFMLYIGDTNVHQDNDLPGFYRSSGPDIPTPVPPVDDGEINTGALTQEVGRRENAFNYPSNNNMGSYGGNSYGGIIGLAYWARTNDVRKDMGGNQYIKTIMIDVLERGDYHIRGGKNTNIFYWAAKYGGFNANEAENKGGKPAITERSQWTNDAAGYSSLRNVFPDGVPSNYAAANNPESLVDALKKSFNNIGARSETPTQAALALDLNSAGVLDISPNNLIVQSSYKQNDYGWQGDVIAYKSSDVLGSNLSTKNPPPAVWKLSDKLKAYRIGWNQRNVMTRAGNNTVPFSSNNTNTLRDSLGYSNGADQDARNLIQYVLGSAEHEGKGQGASTFRQRPDNGLLGTVVNSSVAVIKAPQSNPIAPNQCSYRNLSAVQKRENLYAFAANDGMLHIAGYKGDEKFAYMPTDVLPKLKDFAAPGSSHKFINDGSPVAAELCFGSEAKSIVIGSTGRGGNSIYAIDATNIGTTGSTAGSNNVLWEFNATNDRDLGLTVHKPMIGHLKTDSGSMPVAVLSGGYNAASGNGYLYILKIDNKGAWLENSNYWKIKLGSSGVGMPKILDTDGDSNLDRIYVGDESGNMWRVDYTNGTWQSAKKLFAGEHPITGAPDVFKNTDNYTVVFNTGKYFDDSDASATQQNYAYGLFDKDGSEISSSQLLEQSANTASPVASLRNADSNKAYYSTTQNTLNATHRGWKFKMPAGFISTSDALIRRNRTAQFSAFKIGGGGNIDANAQGNVCAADSGETATIEIDVRTGAMYRDAVFDTNNDKKFVIKKDGDQAAGMVIEKGRIALLSTLATVTINGKQYDVVLKMGDDGKFIMEFLNRFSKGIRRISWREIF